MMIKLLVESSCLDYNVCEIDDFSLCKGFDVVFFKRIVVTK
jgi:hypothetical protein